MNAALESSWMASRGKPIGCKRDRQTEADRQRETDREAEREARIEE